MYQPNQPNLSPKNGSVKGRKTTIPGNIFGNKGKTTITIIKLNIVPACRGDGASCRNKNDYRCIRNDKNCIGFSVFIYVIQILAKK